MNRFLGFFLFFFVSLGVSGQHYNLSLSHNYNNIIDSELQRANLHTGFRPFVKSDILKEINRDSVIQIIINKRHKSTLKRKLFDEHLLIVEGNGFQFYIDPVIHLEKGWDTQETRRSTFTNSRGFILQGNIGGNVSFSSSFIENQSIFPHYLDEYIRLERVIPGAGFARPFKTTGFDYAMSSGYLAIKPSNNFLIQFGHGKHFIGDGYRSLLLSDNSFNYPFLRIQTTFWKVNYTNLYAEMQDINSFEGMGIANYDQMGYAKKYMSSHHLSMNVTSKLNISLYEAVIWRANHAPGTKGFDVNYLNPITLLRPIEFSINSPDNVLVGVHTKYKLPFKAYLYGQFLLDEFSIDAIRVNNGWWGTKFGYQLGAKFNDAFRFKNLSIQTEYNFVRPYTYAHHNPLQNYAHYNQPLAHPLGANFSEKLIIINYSRARWEARAQLMIAKYGGSIKNDPISYGNDLYMSTGNFEELSGFVHSGRPADYGIEMYQGNLSNLNYFQLNLGYIINPVTNLKIDLCIVKRDLRDEIGITNSMFYSLAVKTDIFNRYYDF